MNAVVEVDQPKKPKLADRRLILAIAAEPLNGLAKVMGDHFVSAKDLFEAGVLEPGSDPLIGICEMLADCGVWFGPRRELEEDDNWRQLIPYVVLRKPADENPHPYFQKGEPGRDVPISERIKGDTYLVYRRAGHIEEQRLANRMSIGWGGHIDLPDCQFTAIDELSLCRTVEVSAERELLEELGMVCRTQAMEVLGLIISDDPTGRVHVGLVLVLDCFATVLAKEDLQLELEWLTPEEIIGRDNQEGWTKIVAEQLSK
jgi:predicted NUDIX family phosphoesterase